MGRDADNLADDDEGAAQHGHITAAEEVGQRSDKGGHGGECNQVGGDEPNPSVDAANVSVDDGGDATCSRGGHEQLFLPAVTLARQLSLTVKIGRHLAARPAECHGNKGHEAAKRKLSSKSWSALVSPVSRRTRGWL